MTYTGVSTRVGKCERVERAPRAATYILATYSPLECTHFVFSFEFEFLIDFLLSEVLCARLTMTSLILLPHSQSWRSLVSLLSEVLSERAM